MTDFFTKNIEGLKERFSGIKISNRLPDDLTAQETPSGAVTAKCGLILLHSSYDPVKEADTLAKTVDPKSFICLYGFGLGYHVKAILDRLEPEGRLLVVELNLGILAAAMILRDQETLIRDHRFHLVTGDNEPEVAATLSKHMRFVQDSPDGWNLDVMFHSPSFKCIPSGFQKITNALEILLLERRVPTVFGGLEDQNFALNREIVRKSSGLNSLRGKYRDRPALMISAGPSLDDAIPFLGRIHEHALLACVDTASPILLQYGLQPDFVFSLDPQECNFDFFCDHLETPINLIYIPTANAKTLHQVSGEKFVVFKEGHALSKRDEAMLNKGVTKAGGSVSCLGLDGLIQMGCNPIIMIGQDCAFTGGRTYSRFAQSEEKLLLLVGPTQTLANAHKDKTLPKKRISVPCYSTGETFTDQVLYGYLRNMEQIAQAHPETQIYNLFSHGARIDRVTPLSSINETLKVLRS